MAGLQVIDTYSRTDRTSVLMCLCLDRFTSSTLINEFAVHISYRYSQSALFSIAIQLLATGVFNRTLSVVVGLFGPFSLSVGDRQVCMEP